MNKTVRDLIRAIEANPGWTVQKGGHHFKVRRDGRVVATIAATSSDARAMKNALADLRRAGCPLPRK